MNEPVIITPPFLSGVFLADVKAHLRIDYEDEDALLDSYIATATRHFEWRTGRTMYETELEVTMDRFCQHTITLPRAIPLISISSITYRDSTGASTVLSPSEYVIDSDSGRVCPAYGLSWPSFTPYPVGAVKIRYKAGLANTSPQVYIEDGMQSCIMAMVATLNEYREETFDSEREGIVKFAKNPTISSLIEFYKRNYAY